MTTTDTLTIPEAAERLGISKPLAYRLARRDGRLCEGLPVHKFGSALKVSRAQLEELLGVAEAKAS